MYSTKLLLFLSFLFSPGSGNNFENLTLYHQDHHSKKDKHFFILSGQSNMQLLRPNESFDPILKKEFGDSNVLIAKYALGTQPIRKWYKKWIPKNGVAPKADPVLYDSLMTRVYAVLKNKNKSIQDMKTVTFVWMQGERDARKSFGEVYEQSLLGIYHQLSDDLGRSDINFVIGRLSDYGLKKKGWPHWQMIRNIQENVGNSNSRFGWINTDDLNTGLNRAGKLVSDDIHMTKKGYIVLGERFAKKATEIIKMHQN